jgi:hypothetical protein
MNATRTKITQNRYSGVDATEFSFNQQSGAMKQLGPILGNVSILGPLNAAVGVDLGSLVAIFNDSSTVAWAAMGTTASVAAPTGGANGIALRPNDYTILALYNNNYIICSTATCFGYLINDDLKMTPNAGSNS